MYIPQEQVLQIRCQNEIHLNVDQSHSFQNSIEWKGNIPSKTFGRLHHYYTVTFQ